MSRLDAFDLAELRRAGIDERDHEAVEEHLDWMEERMRAPFGDLHDPYYLDALDREAEDERIDA